MPVAIAPVDWKSRALFGQQAFERRDQLPILTPPNNS
jgi:hypothetical protein